MTDTRTEVVELDGFEFMPPLNDACQYSTVFEAASGKPLGTLQRRSALDYGRGPLWRLYATDGLLLRSFYLPGSYLGLARRTLQTLVKYRR